MRVFGLEVESDIALPDLLAGAAPARHAIAIRLVAARPRTERGSLYFEQCPIHAGLRILRCDDGGFEFWFAEGPWARVAPDGSAIDAHAPEGDSLDETLSYVYGVLIGFALRLRGVLALHASAVVIDGWAVAFAGPSGSGKSTSAAALVARGHAALTDDVTAIEATTSGRYVVHAGNPYLRLWPDSARLVGCGPLEELTPTWSKLRMPTDAPPVTAPLAAICLLDGEVGARSAPEILSGAEAVVAMVGTTFLAHLLGPRERATELTALGNLARRVTVFRISPPALPHGVPALLQLARDAVAHAARTA